MTEPPNRKTIRLARAAYDQPDATWLVTVAVLDRRSRPFANSTLAADVVATIDSYVSREKLTVFAGCLMPDHLHLVIATHDQNLIDVVAAIKSITTRVWWKHGGVKEIWQRSFHDEGLRNPDAFDGAMMYVLQNSQDEGLVADWRDYPFRFATIE